MAAALAVVAALLAGCALERSPGPSHEHVQAAATDDADAGCYVAAGEDDAGWATHIEHVPGVYYPECEP